VASGVSHRFGERRSGGAPKAPFLSYQLIRALIQNLWETPEATTAAMAVCGAAADPRPDTKPVGDAGGHDGSDGGASKALFAGLPQIRALTQNLWETPEVTTAAMAAGQTNVIRRHPQLHRGVLSFP
jgi:hypothetical protein